jgi:hypothetical protein
MAKTESKTAAKTATKSAAQPPAKSPAKPAAAAKAALAPAKAATPAPTPTPPPAPKPLLRTTGLSPRQQRLQALLAKTAHASSGAKPLPGASAQAFKAKTNFAGKKTSFQRKAV